MQKNKFRLKYIKFMAQVLVKFYMLNAKIVLYLHLLFISQVQMYVQGWMLFVEY